MRSLGVIYPDREDYAPNYAAASMNLPSGKIKSVSDLGRIVSERRKGQRLTQVELAGLGQLGNRFIGELENGKGTVQFDKVMHVLDLLGLDVLVVERGQRRSQ